MPTPQATPLNQPARNPNNIEAKRYYVFNETGNIMMATTDDTSAPIQESVRKVFAEVAVFYAAMTKAISTTTNPTTNKPYSIYNYSALDNIISGSGLFVHVTEEDVNYKTEQVGASFSKALLEALLGLATGAGEMAFASAMVASIGSEGLRMNQASSHSESKVANIVFVCEYLLGMPIVSTIVVYADVTENTQSLQLGPCFQESSTTSTWVMHKDTYLFVTPSFIHEYAGELDSAETDPDYAQLVNFLRNTLLKKGQVTGVSGPSPSMSPAPAVLESDKTYVMTGQFLGSTPGVLKFVKGTGGSISAASGSWHPDSISFTVTGTTTTAAFIGVYAKSTDKTPIASTPIAYSAKKQSHS